MTERTEVLIVGAGPVGLVLACELLQQGVGVRVIDRRERFEGAGSNQSRAILIWPRILEQLRRIQISDRMLAQGHVLPSVSYFSSGTLRGTVHIDRLADSAYPCILTLAQNDTEAILVQRLRELGGEVETGTELVEINDPDSAPWAVLKHVDGGTETVRPQWLVGADGPGSTTRRLLDIEFNQDPIDVTYGIGDFPIEGDVPNSVQYYYSRVGIGVIVPLRNGMYRVAGNIPHREPGQERPPAEMYQSMLAQRTRLPIRLGDPAWTNSFRPRCGVVRQYRRGRCFLAGDAAHVVSPAGGQGMNIGLQDAVELGWKLGGVVMGRFNESILDSYEPERASAARRVADTSAAQIRFGAARTWRRVLVRDTLFASADKLGVLQRRFAPLLAQTDFTYGTEPSGSLFWGVRKPAQVGDRLPVFAPPTVFAGLPSLDLHEYTVLCWPGQLSNAAWKPVAARLLATFPAGTPVHDLATAIGRAGDAMRELLGPSPAVLAVRPDGHIAYKVAPSAVGELVSFLAAARPTEAAPSAELARSNR